MAGFLILLGKLLWGTDGMMVLLFMGGVMVLFSPTVSPALVMRLYGATPLSRQQMPAVWITVEELARRTGLERAPILYLVPSSMLNAFAVGSREQAAIALTDGLLRGLNGRQLSGVLAHEISHIRSDDLWVMGLADLLSRITSLLSLFGQLLLLLNLPLLLFGTLTINWLAILLLILAPNLSALAQMALSRTREYDADLNAAALTGDPVGLAQALLLIEQVQGGNWERILAPGRHLPEPSLLRTHPDTADRVQRLRELDVMADDYLQPQSQPLPLTGGMSPQWHPVERDAHWHINGLWY